MLNDYKFNDYLDNIRKRTTTLSQINLVIVMTFLIEIAFLLMYFNYRHADDYSDKETKKIIVGFLYFASFVGMVCVIIHQSLIKSGNIMYEEILDEIEWKHKREESYEQQPIETRIILKNYIRSRDLPFAEGKYGAFIYMVCFIVLAIYVSL